MLSTELFKQNSKINQHPKISAILSPELRTHLEEFMAERDITNTWQALVTVVEEHFGIRPGQNYSSLEERLHKLETLLDNLQNEVEEPWRKPTSDPRNLKLGLENGSALFLGKPLKDNEKWFLTAQSSRNNPQHHRKRYAKTCSRCKRQEATRSRKASFFEVILGLTLVSPYRCTGCSNRFLSFL